MISVLDPVFLLKEIDRGSEMRNKMFIFLVSKPKPGPFRKQKENKMLSIKYSSRHAKRIVPLNISCQAMLPLAIYKMKNAVS